MMSLSGSSLSTIKKRGLALSSNLVAEPRASSLLSEELPLKGLERFSEYKNFFAIKKNENSFLLVPTHHRAHLGDAAKWYLMGISSRAAPGLQEKYTLTQIRVWIRLTQTAAF